MGLQRDRFGHFLPRRRRGGAGRRRSRRRNPAQVASAAYRSGYDAIFGRKPKRRGTAKRRAAARRMARDRFGHFVKRRSAPKRRKHTKRARARRPRYATSGRRRYYAARGRRGRFVTKYTPRYTRRAQRRKGVRKHLRAIRSIPAHQRVAGLVRLNPRTGEIIMSRAVATNPRRKRRRNARRATITVNPRKRRRRSHRRQRRARNPRERVLANPGSVSGIINLAKQSVVPMGMGALGGAATGFIDTKLAGKMMVTLLAKLALGIGGAAFLRKKPTLAMGFAGGVFGTIGYNFGVKMGGGMVAVDKNKAIIGIGEMADNDPAMAAMLAGLGDVVNDQISDAASDYNSSLGDVVDDNMGDVVDDMGDVVESYNQP